VEAVIDELAKINAIAWKNNSNWFQDFQEDDDKDQFMKDMYKEAQGLVKIQPEIFTNILERAKSFFTYETYQQTCYREDKYGFPPGLVHADLWAANIMFARDSNGTLTSELIAIIDWQDVHPGKIHLMSSYHTWARPRVWINETRIGISYA
uniref:Uncharacterized protein n=1 Tax=Acrobeloides nanus TaxID=290746 RepID=A0A914EIR8_9BILA